MFPNEAVAHQDQWGGDVGFEPVTVLPQQSNDPSDLETYVSHHIFKQISQHILIQIRHHTYFN